ncbi:serine hydrolase domain-containing protein [Hyphobacterium marinum]|uniref:Serine hydrolase n=1 Tax=Hyphobacterium marinum TaxID=3116574 RepID=A0ABU7LZ95_9PROT|nr:serine hydrolase [Hyphobacterium sp. Y6023]MEE2566776.1 serine hydrolase [Hyphobacterium sp. Y6023]
MITRIAGGLLLLVVLAVSIAAAWFYRPWSEYSPAGYQAAGDPARLVELSQDMRSVFPGRTIQARNPEPLPRNDAPLEVSFDWQGETRTLDQYLTDSTSLGLVVLHRGEIVHESYRSGANPESRLTTWSVAKSFVASLIAIAMQEGHIASLDQTVAEFVPAYTGTDYGDTSLRHLLMMSSGIDFVEDYSAEDSDIRRLFFNAFIFERDIDSMIMEFERDTEPGTELDYISSNTQALSAVVRAIYGMPLADIVEEKIWTPLNMTGEAYWSQNVEGDQGIAVGYCCLNARLVDFARFGQWYLQDGVWDGERLLPEGWVQLATRPNAPFQEPGPDAIYAPRGYGLHFWIPDNPQGEYYAAGIYGQYVWVDERRDVVIARFAADPEWGARTEETFAVFRAIAEAVSSIGESGDE